MLQMRTGQSFFGGFFRNVLCAVLLLAAWGGGQEAEAQNRPAGAPAISLLESHGDFVHLAYTPPADLGKPPATEVRIRFRDPDGNYGNVGGAAGHVRAVNRGTNTISDTGSSLWAWSHNDQGGAITSYRCGGGSPKFCPGNTWDIQIAYTNGVAPVAWSPARRITVGEPREVKSTTLTAGPGAFRVAWVPNEGPAATGWKVQYRKTGASEWTEVDISDGGARSHTQTGLDSEAAYEVQVAATNTRGTSGFPASPQTVTTLAGSIPNDAVFPKRPVNFRAAQSGDNLTLTWDAPTSGVEVSVYRVRWRTGATRAERDAAAWSPPVQVETRTFTVTGVSDSVLYEAQIASINSAVLSFPAFIAWDVTARGPEVTAPNAPRNLRATQSGNSLTLVWQEPNSGPVVSTYQVRWRTGATTAARNAAAWSDPVTVEELTHTIPGVSNAVFYQAQVASVTKQLLTFSDFIQWEATASGPNITLPNAPINLTATQGDGALTLNWDPPASGAAVGTYRVRWRSGATTAERNAAAWSAPAQVTERTYTVPGISNAVLYEAQVASISDDILTFPAFLRWETTVRGPTLTLPRRPVNLNASHSGSTLTLVWNAPSTGLRVNTYRVRWRSGATDAEVAAADWSEPVQVEETTYAVPGISAGTLFEAEVGSITDDLFTFPEFIAWERVLWPNRPAGAPGVSVVPQLVRGIYWMEIHYSRPAFVGFPPTQRVHIRHRNPGSETWINAGGAAGQHRGQLGAGNLWQWNHDNKRGGRVVTLAIANGETWEIEMAYINGETPVNWSAVRTATAGAPGEVNNVEVTAGPGAFQVIWDGTTTGTSPGATGWQVRYRKTGETEYTTVEIADAGARLYVQNGLEPGTEYEVLVAGVNSSGTGIFSQVPKRVIPDAGGTLFTPNHLTATRGEDSVSLTWISPSRGGPYTTYQVRWKKGADDAALEAAEYGNPVAITERVYTITGIANNELYSAQVAAIADSGPRFVFWETVGSSAPEFGRIEVPTLHARAEPYGVTLPPATSPDSTPISQYALGGLPENFGLNFNAETRTISGAPTAAAATAGEATLTYTATDALNFSGETEVTLRFSSAEPQNARAPANLAATRGDGEVALTWDAPPSGGPYSAYQVRWKKGADAAALNTAEYGDPVAATGRAHTISGIVNNERYAAQVAAIAASAPGLIFWDVTIRSAAPEFAAGAADVPTLYARAEPYEITLPAAASPDSTPLTYRLRGLPENFGLNFAAETRILSGIPSAAAITAGAATLTYTATDAVNLSVERQIPVRFGSFDLDADDSGTADKRDSILIARYLLGVTGAALTFGQTGATAENVAAKIDAGKAGASGLLDVDGDSETDGDDGILIARYMFGLRGAALVDGIGDLQESDASGIEAKIAALPSP